MWVRSAEYQEVVRTSFDWLGLAVVVVLLRCEAGSARGVDCIISAKEPKKLPAVGVLLAIEQGLAQDSVRCERTMSGSSPYPIYQGYGSLAGIRCWRAWLASRQR